MIDIETLTNAQFRALPLVTEGESKEIRYAGNGLVVIRLKPTVYSYTHNRTGIVKGTDVARLRVIKQLLPVLGEAGIDHTYQLVNDRWIVSRLVTQPTQKVSASAFYPHDLTAAQIRALPQGNPIEVVVKRRHTGTPKHRYKGFYKYPTRITTTYIDGETVYPEVVVRFDWRNPIFGADGERLADEVLPEPMADWFIDVAAARQTALQAFTALETSLAQKGLELWDICFFISTDGKTVFGEVSPDGMRVRDMTGHLDKDVWRSGGSSELLLEKWQQLAAILEA